jgi:hypothetical protein
MSCPTIEDVMNLKLGSYLRKLIAVDGFDEIYIGYELSSNV